MLHELVTGLAALDETAHGLVGGAAELGGGMVAAELLVRADDIPELA
ncbi:MAG: hypothetical protein M1325_00485 [Actinobacteria bacterium]|nr:hypothetical protein [Actinomycetota bacterium]